MSAVLFWRATAGGSSLHTSAAGQSGVIPGHARAGRRAAQARVALGIEEKLTMGKFDSRETQKMTRRKQQRKKKARLARKAEAVRAERSKKKPSKKRGSSASSSAG